MAGLTRHVDLTPGCSVTVRLEGVVFLQVGGMALGTSAVHRPFLVGCPMPGRGFVYDRAETRPGTVAVDTTQRCSGSHSRAFCRQGRRSAPDGRIGVKNPELADVRQGICVRR